MQDLQGALGAADAESGNVGALLNGSLNLIPSATHGERLSAVQLLTADDSLSGDGSTDWDIALQGFLPDTSLATSGDSASDPVAPEYELPTWAEFRGYVMENGDKYVRASYPNSPADLIETIWCGVPVIEHNQARVMTPKGEWLVY